MKFIATRPVTIHSTRNAARWFPFVYRHSDGTIFLSIENGYDAHCAPIFRMRSLDNGRTWLEEGANVPRYTWAHSFVDGELFEIDQYGLRDPNSPETACFYGAWSYPSVPLRPVQEDLVRAQVPNLGGETLSQIHRGGYPTYPWWPLYNRLLGKEEVGGDDIIITGPYFTDGVEVDGVLLAVGYAGYYPDGVIPPQVQLSDYSVLLLESSDRGHNWKLRSLVARTIPEASEGFNEASLVQLKNGELYSVMRSGKYLYHTWSRDTGHSWEQPKQLLLSDEPDHLPQMAWPRCIVLEDGTLVLAYGRPGKHIVFDPTGTGKQWQGHLNLHEWELETQEYMGVPPELRLRGDTSVGTRYWDSSDYLGLLSTGPREFLVFYDVQNYMENWNSVPVSGVRMLRVALWD